MKNIGIHIKIIALVVLIGVGFTSCKEDGDLAPMFKPALLNTINTISNPVNVYQNGTRLNNLGTIGTGGQSGYFSVASGTQQYQLKKAGPDSPEYLINDYSLTLDVSKRYSLFVAGETPDKLFMVNDNQLNSSTQASIRFVNTLPGTDNLDVTIGGLSYSNTAFKSASVYSYINSGATSLKIYRAGTTTPVIDQTITLTAGTPYTVFTIGTLTGTGQNKFSVRMVIN